MAKISLAIGQPTLNNVTTQWYTKTNGSKRQSICFNKLGSIIKRMSTTAVIVGDRNITNYSASKYLVKKLNEIDIPANQIMQFTEHKKSSL